VGWLLKFSAVCGWLLKFTNTSEFWLKSKDQQERINSVAVYMPMCLAEMRKHLWAQK